MLRNTTLLGVLLASFIVMLFEVDHVGQRNLIHREEGDSPAVDHSKQNRSLAHTYMVSLFIGGHATTTTPDTVFSTISSNAYNISFVLTQEQDRGQLLNRPTVKSWPFANTRLAKLSYLTEFIGFPFSIFYVPNVHSQI
jgi:hypothetical protein